MRKLKLSNVIMSLLVLISVLTLNSIGANAEWKHSTNGWWNTEKSYMTGWQFIKGNYYYYNIDGAMVHDTNVDGYYLDASGAMDPSKDRVQVQDITMKTEERVYPLGTKDINVYITNNTSIDSGYGTPYKVEKFEDNEWHSLDFSKNARFEDVSIFLLSQETNKENCNLDTLKDFKDLTSGKYRIVKEVSNSVGYTNISAEFSLQ